MVLLVSFALLVLLAWPLSAGGSPPRRTPTAPTLIVQPATVIPDATAHAFSVKYSVKSKTTTRAGDWPYVPRPLGQHKSAAPNGKAYTLQLKGKTTVTLTADGNGWAVAYWHNTSCPEGAQTCAVTITTKLKKVQVEFSISTFRPRRH